MSMRHVQTEGMIRELRPGHLSVHLAPMYAEKVCRGYYNGMEGHGLLLESQVTMCEKTNLSNNAALRVLPWRFHAVTPTTEIIVLVTEKTKPIRGRPTWSVLGTPLLFTQPPLSSARWHNWHNQENEDRWSSRSRSCDY